MSFGPRQLQLAAIAYPSAAVGHRLAGSGVTFFGTRPMAETHRNTITGAVQAPTVQARSIGTVVMAPTLGAVVRVPHQLPAVGARGWVNRAAELAVLDRLPVVSGSSSAVLSGMGGVGKTALAVHWLLRQREAFPDGELYCDLAGWSRQSPSTSAQVLAAWLRALGVPADDVPHELTELAALYRTVMADRSMLILADNARTADQVRPLLPASSTSVLLVTSRYRLPELALDGFDHIDLECLSTQDATSLLANLLPGYQPAQYGVLEGLAERCGGLPLAVALAGCHLAIRKHDSAARLLARLEADPRHRLQLSVGERSVGAVFDVSYDNLDPQHARLFRLCALHPGATFTAGPVATAWKQSETDTENALAILADAHLIIEVSPGRYRLHDVVREYADQLIEQHDAIDDHDVALRLMIWWYLARTADADMALNPFAPRFGEVFRFLESSTFGSPTEAMAWFESERDTILATQELAAARGWDEQVYGLAEALWNPMRPNYTADELYRSQWLGVEAARRAAHLLEGACLFRVAFAETNRGRHDAAIAAATDALDRGTALDHSWTKSAALSMRARAHLAADDPQTALADLDLSMAIEKTLAHPERGIALRERQYGQCYAHPKIADYVRAVQHLQRALTLMRSIGDEVGYTRVAIDLAVPLLETDQAPAALAELEQIEPTMRAYGSIGYTADLCAALGRVHAQLGHVREARGCYSEALNLYEAAGRGATGRRDAVVALRDALPDTVHNVRTDTAQAQGGPTPGASGRVDGSTG